MKEKFNLLPIGSVVSLDGVDERVMITGYYASYVDDNGVVGASDYIAVPYPEGDVGNDARFVFDNEDIVMVFFRGYEDKERKDFIEFMEADLDELDDESLDVPFDGDSYWKDDEDYENDIDRCNFKVIKGFIKQ